MEFMTMPFRDKENMFILGDVEEVTPSHWNPIALVSLLGNRCELKLLKFESENLNEQRNDLEICSRGLLCYLGISQEHCPHKNALSRV